ncbi:hypothetical protein AYO21_03400 [Fonsecaea monophora]|uniref:Uncharacterized protein n=1 Tax=Fonsecaea monophora TaxID=254056 RepID=A0A177FFJ3_9EURO|nr:hypothetical protein AYO21_03400 [Fonsecaea monophora]OAG42232.1 hypothetical protein AYO21_03400 [Fonsecaea monophora]
MALSEGYGPAEVKREHYLQWNTVAGRKPVSKPPRKSELSSSDSYVKTPYQPPKPLRIELSALKSAHCDTQTISSSTTDSTAHQTLDDAIQTLKQERVYSFEVAGMRKTAARAPYATI